jgi:hypothetical protein
MTGSGCPQWAQKRAFGFVCGFLHCGQKCITETLFVDATTLDQKLFMQPLAGR